MTDHDLRIRQQRGKLRRIVLIVEDRGLQRRLDLGENPRRDRGGEMAEKQGFHVLPSPTHDDNAIVGASAIRSKEFGAAPTKLLARARRGAHQTGDAISLPWERASRIRIRVNRKRAAM